MVRSLRSRGKPTSTRSGGCVAELKELGKPFIVVLNSTHPEAESTRTLGEALARNYDAYR